MAADQYAAAAHWARLVDWWIFPTALFLWVIAGLLTPERGREAKLPFLGQVAEFAACLLIFTFPAINHHVSRSLASASARATMLRQSQDLVLQAVSERTAFDESGAWVRVMQALACDPDNPLGKEYLLNAPTLEELLARRKAQASSKDRFEQVKTAMWCREQGDEDLAKREMQVVLAASPDDPTALRFLGPGTERPQKPSRTAELPPPPAAPENVFADRPAEPAGLNAGHAGLPIGKNTGVQVPPGMVCIPEGPYPIHEPRQEVRIAAFLMDRCEVTNAEYAKFLQEVEKKSDAECRHPRQPQSKDHTPSNWSDPIFNAADLPVVGVDWFDAYAYAKWAGKRLPTETEWEAAARGSDGRNFPWGGRWERWATNTPDRFLFYELWGWAMVDWAGWVPSNAARDAFIKLDATAPCGAFMRDESPTGCFDMAGNVEEWVADWFQTDTGSPASKPEGTICGIRGGSWVYGGIDRQKLYYRTGDLPLSRTPYRGFRCAR